MKPIPAADVLLEACARYLEQELLPTLTGYHRFQTRVSVNALLTVMRELRLQPAMAAAQAERLAALLADASSAPGVDTTALDITAADRELCRRIDDATLAVDDPALVEHLRASLSDALAIDSPRWAPPYPRR